MNAQFRDWEKLSLRYTNKGIKQSFQETNGAHEPSKEMKSSTVWISCSPRHLPADLLLAACSPCTFPRHMPAQSADDQPCRPVRRVQHQWRFSGSQDRPGSLLVCLLILRAASRAQCSAERSPRRLLGSFIADSWLAARPALFKRALLRNDRKCFGLAKCNGRIFREINQILILYGQKQTVGDEWLQADLNPELWGKTLVLLPKQNAPKIHTQLAS